MNIICMVQARMVSSRLPEKVMITLSGKPMIQHILESLVRSKTITDLVVLTTTQKRDDKLVKYLKKNNWKYFRGDENDVLKRYYDAAIRYNADYIIRITADNPLTDPSIVDLVVTKAIENKVDYASNNLLKTYPLGYVVEVISRNTLEKIEKLARGSILREHVTPYIYKNLKKFKTLNVATTKSLSYPNWRLTVDTIEDFKLIKKIFENLYSENKSIKYEDVVEFILKNPELLKINKNIRQVKV